MYKYCSNYKIYVYIKIRLTNILTKFITTNIFKLFESENGKFHDFPIFLVLNIRKRKVEFIDFPRNYWHTVQN